MPGELDSEQIENFALQPIRARPNRNKGIDHGIAAAQLHADAQFLLQRNGNQLIVQFKARFERVAVKASCVGEEIELQLFDVATLLGNAPQHLAGHDDRRIAPEFNHFLDRVCAPRAELRDYRISLLTTTVRHRFRIPALRRLFMPVEFAFFPQLDIADQEEGDVDQPLDVAEQPKGMKYLDHIAVNVGPRVQKDRLD